MYELMVNVLWIDHHDVFGIFGHHSFLQVHQNLGEELLMYLLQIVGILHDQLDQNYVMHARTIESNEWRKNIEKIIEFEEIK